MNTHLINDKLAHYVSQPNGLDYTRALVGHITHIEEDEIELINSSLCGAGNHAYCFMVNPTLVNAEAFFNNVRHNGPRSNSIIVRAIQIALQNQPQ